MALLTLDGSQHEGGGAMLRVALAMSSVTHKPFKMTNIRAGRSAPGLKQQHIVGIKALQELTGAKTTDLFPGSKEIMFIPGKTMKSLLVINAKTAASITLILQSLLPVIIHQNIHQKKTVKLTLIGGTDVSWSPPIDYFKEVFLPAIDQYAQCTVKVKKRGYYPKGGGHIELIITPQGSGKPLNKLVRGNLLAIKGMSHASSQLQEREVAERQQQIIQLSKKDDETITLAMNYAQTLSPGSGILLWAIYQNTTLGVDVLGKREIPAEQIGKEALQKLRDLMDSNAVVDEHLADQLIPYLALYGGSIITNEITQHTLANIHICEQFTEKTFETLGNKIVCR